MMELAGSFSYINITFLHLFVPAPVHTACQGLKAWVQTSARWLPRYTNSFIKVIGQRFPDSTSQLQVNLSPTNGSLLFCAVGLKSWMLPFMGNVSSGGLVPSKDLS